MKTPIVLVTVALTVAILLAASLLIATSTRGAEVAGPPAADRVEQLAHTLPAAK